MSKVIFFIRDINNHQGTHLRQSAIDTVTNFNLYMTSTHLGKTTQQHHNGGHGEN